jgi:Ca2+/Na+ antiporter
MCLEGMLTSAMSQVPILKYFSSLITFIIFVAALYFSIMTGSVVHMIVACCCPLLYLIYHFATNGKKNNTTDTNSDMNSDMNSI